MYMLKKDRLDIKNTIENQRYNMDWNYLMNHCKELFKF